MKSHPLICLKVITNVVKFIIILFFTVEALNVLQLEVLNNIGSAILEYLPLLVSALLILGIGFFLANLLDKWIRRYTGSKASGNDHQICDHCICSIYDT